MRNHINSRAVQRVIAVLAAALALIAVSDGASLASASTSARRPGPTVPLPDPSTLPTPAPVIPCGLQVHLKADNSLYSCSFSDEFSGSALDSGKWTPITTAATGQRTGVECVVDTPDTLSVGGEALTITARRLKRPINCDSPWGAFSTSYTGGMITTHNKFAQAYGRFEMRARFPKAPLVDGLQSSLWMYPQAPTYGSQWPASGEIDIAEWYSGFGDIAVPNLHYVGDSDDPYKQRYNCTINNPSAYHTYAVEWTPSSIEFLYDGRTCLRDVNWTPDAPLTMPAPFDKPFNLLIGNGRGTGPNNAPTSSTPFPSNLQVDYVRAWS